MSEYKYVATLDYFNIEAPDTLMDHMNLKVTFAVLSVIGGERKQHGEMWLGFHIVNRDDQPFIKMLERTMLSAKTAVAMLLKPGVEATPIKIEMVD